MAAFIEPTSFDSLAEVTSESGVEGAKQVNLTKAATRLLKHLESREKRYIIDWPQVAKPDETGTYDKWCYPDTPEQE